MKQIFNDGKRNHFMLQKDWHSRREIASLTKIMTWYTVLKLIDKFKLNKSTELVSVSKEATGVIGTSAELKENDLLSVWDLLHALMLPSGNDAAHALAEHFGEILLRCGKQTTKTLFYSNKSIKPIVSKSKIVSAIGNMCTPIIDSNRYNFWGNSFESYYNTKFTEESLLADEKKLESNETSQLSGASVTEEANENSESRSPWSPVLSLSMYESNMPVFRFIQEMNKNARDLGMENTKFDSPHGLPNKNNKSTAYDIAKLWLEWVKIRDFNTITKAKVYLWNNRKGRSSYLTSLKQEKGAKADYKWKNTNKLLNKGYWGIKTGITNTAGPWLAAYISKKKRAYLVILLNSRSMDARWVEVMKMVEHYSYVNFITYSYSDVFLNTARKK